MHEPGIGSSIARRLDRFLPPLHESLRVGESAFLFRMTGCGKKEYLGFDLLGPHFAALNLG